MITWTQKLGGQRDVACLIDELRGELFIAGLTPADVDTVEERLREVLDAERT